MRVLVFAGVFDPVHNGHVSVVEQALAMRPGSKAVVVAEKIPQHKHGSTPYQHRHAMLQLAFSSNSDISVLEAPISEHTVKPFFTWLGARFHEATFSWLVGSDVLSHMSSWIDINKLPLLRVDEILCFLRSEDNNKDVSSIGKTTVIYKENSPENKHLQSKNIRQDLSFLNERVHPSVATYIKSHGLYKTT